MAAAGPLDVLINNAAQTVRRSAEAYAPLVAAEAAALPEGDLPDVVVLGPTTDGADAALPAANGNGHWAPTPPPTRSPRSR